MSRKTRQVVIVRTPKVSNRNQLATSQVRDACTDHAGEAYAQGALSEEEFRVMHAAIMSARTHGELAQITANLPPVSELRPAAVSRRLSLEDALRPHRVAGQVIQVLTLGTGAVTGLIILGDHLAHMSDTGHGTVFLVLEGVVLAGAIIIGIGAILAFIVACMGDLWR